MKLFLVLFFTHQICWSQSPPVVTTKKTLELAKPTADSTITPPPSENVQYIYKKSETLQFSGSKLKGQFKKPDLSYIYERKGLRQEQIVHIPENFNKEIINAASEF